MHPGREPGDVRYELCDEFESLVAFCAVLPRIVPNERGTVVFR